MYPKRKMRVRQAVKEHISDILRREVKDPRIGFATVTSVEVTDDMRYARIYVSVLGTPKECENTMLGLKSATPYARMLLGERLGVRYTPEIEFRLDHSIEHGARIFEMLRDLVPGDQEHEEPQE